MGAALGQKTEVISRARSLPYTRTYISMIWSKLGCSNLRLCSLARGAAASFVRPLVSKLLRETLDLEEGEESDADLAG